MTLEKFIAPHLDENTFYKLRAFELWPDGFGGHGVNSSWIFDHAETIKEALQAARGRFEIYKINYSTKARIMDLEMDFNECDHSITLIHHGIPVVCFSPSNATR